jgi:hypothetical protein
LTTARGYDTFGVSGPLSRRRLAFSIRAPENEARKTPNASQVLLLMILFVVHLNVEVVVGMNPIVTLEKQLLNMVGNLV